MKVTGFRTVRRALALWALLLAAGRFSAAQEKPEVANPKSGAVIFKQDCAVCHGEDAKGHGPASTALTVRPPNLTTLAQRHGGKFPDDYVLSVLRNGVKAPAHGTAEMPIWVQRWVKPVLPNAIRIEMAPLAPDLGRLQPVTLTIPVHVTRLPLPMEPYQNEN